MTASTFHSNLDVDATFSRGSPTAAWNEAARSRTLGRQTTLKQCNRVNRGRAERHGPHSVETARELEPRGVLHACQRHMRTIRAAVGSNAARCRAASSPPIPPQRDRSTPAAMPAQSTRGAPRPGKTPRPRRPGRTVPVAAPRQAPWQCSLLSLVTSPMNRTVTCSRSAGTQATRARGAESGDALAKLVDARQPSRARRPHRSRPQRTASSSGASSIRRPCRAPPARPGT